MTTPDLNFTNGWTPKSLEWQKRQPHILDLAQPPQSWNVTHIPETVATIATTPNSQHHDHPETKTLKTFFSLPPYELLQRLRRFDRKELKQ
jgi:hypothetical protein